MFNLRGYFRQAYRRDDASLIPSTCDILLSDTTKEDTSPHATIKTSLVTLFAALVAAASTAFSIAFGITSTSPTAGVGYAAGAGGAVTQATSSSTGVTLNKVCGRITTVALTTAAGAEEVFTLTNSAIQATDTIDISTTYTGAGTPAFSVKGVANGSCVIVITNLHASAAFNAAMVLNFGVNKRVAA